MDSNIMPIDYCTLSDTHAGSWMIRQILNKCVVVLLIFTNYHSFKIEAMISG